MDDKIMLYIKVINISYLSNKMFPTSPTSTCIHCTLSYCLLTSYNITPIFPSVRMMASSFSTISCTMLGIHDIPHSLQKHNYYYLWPLTCIPSPLPLPSIIGNSPLLPDNLNTTLNISLHKEGEEGSICSQRLILPLLSTI